MKKERAGTLLSVFAAGMIEAFSITELHGAFSVIQAGNLLLGAVALANGRWAAVGLHLLSVAGFLVGTALRGLLSAKLKGRRWLLGKGILAVAVLIPAMLLPQGMEGATVCLLALLCGFWFQGLPRRGDGGVPVIVFGAGVLLGSLWTPCLGNLVLAICVVLFLAATALKWRQAVPLRA